MAIFRTHREAARANNHVIALFFGVTAILTVIFALIAVGHYLTGWW